MEWLTPESFAGGGALVVFILGAFRLLSEDRDRSDIIAGLRDEVRDLKTKVGELEAEIRSHRADVDLWQGRAYEAGWRPDNA